LPAREKGAKGARWEMEEKKRGHAGVAKGEKVKKRVLSILSWKREKKEGDV